MATLPDSAAALDFKITTQPTKTYRLDFLNRRIVGDVDELAAMVQAVRKALTTARYAERIYSGDFGGELQKLIGRGMPYVQSVLLLTLEDALSADTRIKGVKNLDITQTATDCLEVSAEILTEYGEIYVTHEIRG